MMAESSGSQLPIPLEPEGLELPCTISRADVIMRLHHDELMNIQRCAHARHDPKEKAGLEGNPYGPLSQGEHHVLGVACEYAVSKYLHVPMDWSTRLSGDKNYADLIAGMEANGCGPWRIEVKGTRKRPPILIFNTPWHFNAHVGVLGTMSDDYTVHLCGWITQQEFLQKHRKGDLGYGPRLIADLYLLHHMMELKARLYDRRFIMVDITSESKRGELSQE